MLQSNNIFIFVEVVDKYSTIPISFSFQAPKYIIKVKDPYLKLINIVVPGFVAGIPPKDTQQVELLFQCTVEEEATPSQLAPKETVRVVEVLDSEEDFEDFN